MGLLTVLKKMKLKEKEMRILILGLDNAGKTTILKRFNGEEIDTISPTLGFNIKTLEHRGLQWTPFLNQWTVACQNMDKSLISREQVDNNFVKCNSALCSEDTIKQFKYFPEYENGNLCTEGKFLFITQLFKPFKYKLNVWDVGGQKSLRSYWRNYFESTDGLIWVVDSADKRRLDDCRKELHALLREERLAGATLLVFSNKQDLPGALHAEEIRDVLELESIKTHHWQIVWCSAVTGQNLLQGIDWLIDDIAARIFTLE